MTESERKAALEARQKYMHRIFDEGDKLPVTEDGWLSAVQWAWNNPPEEEKDGGSGQFGVGA